MSEFYHQQTFKLWRTSNWLTKGQRVLIWTSENQDHGCRLVGQINEKADHPTLPGNNRTWLQIHEYSITFRECHLFVYDREGQSPYERRLGSGSTTKKWIQYVQTFILQDMPYNTEFPVTVGTRVTTINVDILVIWRGAKRGTHLFGEQERNFVMATVVTGIERKCVWRYIGIWEFIGNH